MSLDVHLRASRPIEVFHRNITSNLVPMAAAAGLYTACWRPEDIFVTRAIDLVPLLRAGLDRLEADPARFKALDSPNGWGTYERFVPWVRAYLRACEENPDAEVSVSR